MKWQRMGVLKLFKRNLTLRSRIYKANLVGIKLSEEQRFTCKLLEETNDHYFITGKAGTGKSVVLNYFGATTKKNVVKVAPTGVAAMNIQGQTIHSLFRLSSGFIDIKKVTINSETRQLLYNIDAVIIDEISMVRVDMIDGIDSILKNVKGNNLPFGGVQIIAFGDIYQLPPVVDSQELRNYFSKVYGGPYFFNASVWKKAKLHTHELQTVFRQSDKVFKDVLDSIRDGRTSKTDLDILRTRIVRPGDTAYEKVLTLTTTNVAAQRINIKRLDSLKTKQKTYYARITGTMVANAFPTESELVLKVGAQVLFLKNDPALRWVNGTIGTIKYLSKNSVKIHCGTKTYEVGPETWEKQQYYFDDELGVIEQKVVSTFTQLPLKLAWAITVHKSQGTTYDSVVVDIRDGAFAHGQTYVALSRCRSLSGLHLIGEVRLEDIIIEPLIINFMNYAHS